MHFAFAQKYKEWSYLIPQKIGNYYGFISNKNELVSESIYDSVKYIKREEWHNELYAIFKNGKMGLINAYETRDTGEYYNYSYIIAPIYDSIQACSSFWNCYLNGKIEVIDVHNNQLFATSKVEIACYVTIRIGDYLSGDKYDEKKSKQLEKIRAKLKAKNDALVKRNNNYAPSFNILLLYGKKYYEIAYSSPKNYKKREVMISKYLQRVIDADKNKCQYKGKNILSL